MFKSIKIQLAPNKRQYSTLLETMHVFNEACNSISSLAYENGCFDLKCLHKQAYNHIRSSYGFTSQMTTRAIKKVLEPHKTYPHRQIRFKLDGAVPYDKSGLSWGNKSMISLQTTHGREKIPIKLKKYHNYPNNLFKSGKNLIHKDNTFYVQFIVEIPDKHAYKSVNVTTLV